MLPSRSAWLSGSAAALTAAVLPRIAAAQSLTPLKVGVGLIEPQAEAYYARAQGFFRARGLDATLTVSANGAATSAAIAGGALEVGITSVLGLAQAIQRGLPFVTIAPGSIHDSRFPSSGVLVLPDSPIKTAKDLIGKTVAVATARGLDQLLVTVLVDKAGGDVSGVKFIEMRPPTMLAALEAGRVDAINVENPEYGAFRPKTRLIADGEDAIGKLWVETTWFSTKDWLAKNTETARRFRDAIITAGTWAMSNPEAAAAVLREDIKVDEPRATQRFATGFNLGDYQILLDTAAKYDFIKPIKAADFVKTV